MFETIRRLALGVALIGLAAGVLLYTDRGSRNRARRALSGPTQTGNIFRVALVQHASLNVLEQGAEGLLSALAQRGYADGQRLQIRRYNAEGDMGTANAIAKEVATGGFDLLLTLSTVSLQTVHNANRVGAQTPHVFGLVTDPFSAGVGIEATNHLIHPPYLAGAGSLQPVEKILQTARLMRPELKSVGLVWNAAEANSLAQTKIARRVCVDLGLNLIEANAENSAAVLESVNSVIARGAECMFISGDVTVSLATDQVIGACRRAGIPVFSALPPTVERGTLFDLGANYDEIGRHIGGIAADVLEGKNPAQMPIENFVRVILLYNETALPGLRDRWTIPESVRREAAGWITSTVTNLPVLAAAKHAPPKPQPDRIKFPDDSIKASQVGKARPSAANATPAPAPSRPFKVDVIEYIDTPNVEENRDGIRAGLEKSGLKAGRDFEFRVRNAQGDMATLSTMIDAAVSDQTDLLLVCTTPALQAALRRAGNHNVVFSLVANPVIAGAGKSDKDHVPNVTGAYIPAPHAEGLAALRQCLPHVRRIGTLFVPAEVNSVFYKDELLKAAAQLGLQVELVAVSNSNEITDGAIALCGRNIEVVCQISDNLTGASFASIAQATQRARVPLMAFASAQVKNGAFMAVSRDFYDGGVASGQIAARVLQGESPAQIPFQLVETIKYKFNPTSAAAVGITIPKEVLRRGDLVN